jgi:hypothetical protein
MEDLDNKEKERIAEENYQHTQKIIKSNFLYCNLKRIINKPSPNNQILKYVDYDEVVHEIILTDRQKQILAGQIELTEREELDGSVILNVKKLPIIEEELKAKDEQIKKELEEIRKKAIKDRYIRNYRNSHKESIKDSNARRYRELRLKLNDSEVLDNYKGTTEVFCPGCNGKAIKSGFIYSKDKKIQRYRCSECQYVFTKPFGSE